MRSNLSPAYNSVDWPAAAAVIGVGPIRGAGKSLRDGLKDPLGSPYPMVKANILANGPVLASVLAMLEQYPAADSIAVQQEFRFENDYRLGTSGSARISGLEKRMVLLSRDWPNKVDDRDWDDIDEQATAIKFSVTREAVDLFTINGVTAMAPLAEMILQQQWYKLDAGTALAHVRAALGEERVAQGKRPQRWGAPGLKLIDAYLEQGGNPSGMDASGVSPLGAALYLQQSEIVRKLVDAGADINAPAAGGLFPTDLAVLSGDPAMVRFCAELGALPDTDGYLQPVIRAVDIGSPDVLEALINAGANVEVETPDGISLADYIVSKAGENAPFMLSVLTAKFVEQAIDASADDAKVSHPRARRSGMSL